VGIESKVFDHGFWPAEWGLCIHDPIGGFYYQCRLA
jgi:hypothetical protein